MSIQINCNGADIVELNELTEFDAKRKYDTENLKRSIKKYGFSFPLYIWPHMDEHTGDFIKYVLDGNGRLKALRELQDAGELVPPLPCVFVFAKDKNEAREKKTLLIGAEFAKQ